MEGAGPDLSLPEAAVLLGTSVEGVRRRIKAGRINAFHDARGRLRIRASLNPAHEGLDPSRNLAEVWEELKTAKHKLAEASANSEELQRELDMAHFHRREAQVELESLQNETRDLNQELATAREALEQTQKELASMWRVMSSRKQPASQLAQMADGNEAFDLPPTRIGLDQERSRIRDQIDRARELSKRRRWPWAQAS